MSDQAMVQEIVAEEMELFETLVVTDCDRLQAQLTAGHLPGARVAVVTDEFQQITSVDQLALHAARVGKAIRTWCTQTDRGRHIAREAARTLDPAIVGGRKVLHITVPPDQWQPVLHPFDSLIDSARTTVPASPGRQTTVSAEPPPFDPSPAEVARRIILRFGEDLLIVAPPQQSHPATKPNSPAVYSTGYSLGDNGIWCAGGDPWARWLIEIADMMTRDAALSGLSGKALTATLATINRIKRPGMVDQVRPMLRAVLDLLRRNGEPCRDVTECAAEDLDAELRYLGVANGVMDLALGTLLPPEEGRKALVTILAPTKFDPDARHPVVDDLLERMDPKRRRHFLGALGNALRAVPKRLYAIVCEPDCAKTTYHNLLVNTLGRVYVRTAGANVVQDRRNAMTSDTQLTPGLTAWWTPTRIIIMDEVKESSLSPEIVKDLTGGGLLSARGMRQDLQTKQATATTFMMSNEETVPQLRLDDSGMRARYRELRLPHIPDGERDEGYIRDEATQLPDVRAAFLAVLVDAAKENPEPPSDTPEVMDTTAKRIAQDAGELGRFARRIVRDGASRLAFSDMWAAWCQANSEPTEAKGPGGIGKRTIVRRLRSYVSELPDPVTVRLENRNSRGWRGWKLLEPDDPSLEPQPKASSEPKYVPGAEADQAIRDLLADFPKQFPVFDVVLDRRIVLACLIGVRNDFWLVALRDEYKNGQELYKKLTEISEIVSYHGPEKKLMTSADSMRAAYPDLGDYDLAAGWLDHTISMLARSADRSRPVGPVFEQVRDRFNSIKCKSGWASMALETLFEADRSLGPDADAQALVEEAVRLLVDELSDLPLEEAKLYDAADIEAAVKELAGLQPSKDADTAEPEQVAQELEIY